MFTAGEPHRKEKSGVCFVKDYPELMFMQVHESVGRVCIQIPDRRITMSGTGFLVKKDCVMTAYHVVEDMISKMQYVVKTQIHLVVCSN